ncbi:MAG: ATP-binding protein [Selenomonadaceae bacterium]|nr:ATP-binding protein [Selenomonadaceae bacterium]
MQNQIDELSYTRLFQDEAELIFKVIAERSERPSTIITMNLPFSRWTEILWNSTSVAVLVARFTYRSTVLDMNGRSYQLAGGRKRQAEAIRLAHSS